MRLEADLLDLGRLLGRRRGDGERGRPETFLIGSRRSYPPRGRRRPADRPGSQTFGRSPRAGMLAAVIAAMRRIVSRCLGLALAVLLPGCTLSRPRYVTPDVHVGEPAFGRALEAHTVSRPLDRAVPPPPRAAGARTPRSPWWRTPPWARVPRARAGPDGSEASRVEFSPGAARKDKWPALVRTSRPAVPCRRWCGESSDGAPDVPRAAHRRPSVHAARRPRAAEGPDVASRLPVRRRSAPGRCPPAAAAPGPPGARLRRAAERHLPEPVGQRQAGPAPRARRRARRAQGRRRRDRRRPVDRRAPSRRRRRSRS